MCRKFQMPDMLFDWKMQIRLIHLQHTMKTTLFLITLSLGLVSCTTSSSPTESNALQEQDFAYGTVQQYGGNVGSRFAMFQLTWQPNGNVTGSYHHPADNGSISYQLKGKNTAQGQLVLTEFTHGQQTAIITLSKSIRGELVTWSGNMHNTDGRIIPVNITRRL